MDSLKKLGELMARHGAMIRVLPEQDFMVIEKTQRALDHFPTEMWPKAKVIYFPEYKREMLAVARIPKWAGKFIVTFPPGTSTSDFGCKWEVYDSLEDILKMLESRPLNQTTEILRDWQENDPVLEDEEKELSVSSSASQCENMCP